MNKIEDYEFEYYCGHCGSSGLVKGKRFIEENGDIIRNIYYAECPNNCGDYVGQVEIFKYINCDYLSKEDLQIFQNNT